MTAADVVYVVRPGENPELRYSLRSVHANLPHARVWIAGTVPAWTRGVVALPLSPIGEKFANQRQSLTAAVSHPDLSDEFVLLNDDHFVIEPVQTLPCVHLGPASGYVQRRLAKGQNPHNTWFRGVRASADWMAHLGHGDVDVYEAHIPLRFRKARLYELLDGWPTDRTFLAGMTYAATGTAEGERGGNVKVPSRDPETLQKKLALGLPFLSTNDDSFALGAVGQWLRDRFPEPSPYEEAS